MELKLQRFLQEFKKKKDAEAASNPEQKAKDDEARKLELEKKKAKERQIQTGILTHSITQSRVRGLFTCRIPDQESIASVESTETLKNMEDTKKEKETEKEKEKKREKTKDEKKIPDVCFELLIIKFQCNPKLNIAIADITQVETVIIRNGQEIHGDDVAKMDDKLSMKWPMNINHSDVELTNVRYGDYFEIPFELDFASEKEVSMRQVIPIEQSFIVKVHIDHHRTQLFDHTGIVGTKWPEEILNFDRTKFRQKIEMLVNAITILKNFEKSGVSNQVVDYKFLELEWAWIARRMIACDGPKQITNPQWVGCIQSLFNAIQHIVDGVLKIQDRSKLKQMRVIEHEKELNEMKMNEIEISPFKSGFMAITDEVIMGMVSEMLLFFYYTLDRELTNETLEICKKICARSESFCVMHSHFMPDHGLKPSKSITDLLAQLYSGFGIQPRSTLSRSNQYTLYEQFKFLKETILEDASASRFDVGGTYGSKKDKLETADGKKKQFAFTRQDIKAITLKYKGIVDTLLQRQYINELEMNSKNSNDGKEEAATATTPTSTFELIPEEVAHHDERETRGYSKRRQIVQQKTTTVIKPFIFVPLQDTTTTTTTFATASATSASTSDTSSYTFDFGFNANLTQPETKPFDFSSFSKSLPDSTLSTSDEPFKF